MESNQLKLVCILGATASGKTAFAARLADRLDGEIISADSRQVYRQMNIGTGKDLDDYKVGDHLVPFHLIDIADPGYEYNVYEFQQDFRKAFDEIHGRGKIPILCGGSGLYIEAVLSRYELIRVPLNPDLRKNLEGKDLAELENMLKAYRNVHNTTDSLERKRAVRAIEIEEYYRQAGEVPPLLPEIRYLVFGIRFDRESRRQRITERLRKRLDSGLIEEVEKLLDSGISPEKLIFYGLEYKYLTWYLQNKISRDELFNSLNTAIHQFAKRQMTWFRKMERKGFTIHWLDGHLPMEEKIARSLEILENSHLNLKGK